jgi:hypothetical protein
LSCNANATIAMMKKMIPRHSTANLYFLSHLDGLKGRCASIWSMYERKGSIFQCSENEAKRKLDWRRMGRRRARLCETNVPNLARFVDVRFALGTNPLGPYVVIEGTREQGGSG